MLDGEGTGHPEHVSERALNDRGPDYVVRGDADSEAVRFTVIILAIMGVLEPDAGDGILAFQIHGEAIEPELAR